MRTTTWPGQKRSARWRRPNRAVRDAQYLWDNYTLPSTQENLTATEAISMTLQLLDRARARFEPYKYEDSGNDTPRRSQRCSR